MKKKKIAFLVDNDLGVLLALWAMKNENANIEYLVLCKEENKKHFDKLNIKIYNNEKEIFKLNPDIIFSINFWKIIEKEYTERFTIVNLHHSYNLTYRGRHTCSWAIINARKYNNWQHGTTLHIIDERVDCGKIICSYSCPIYENDTAYSLFLRVEELAKNMFKENYRKILQGEYKTKSLPPGRFYYKASDLDHFIDLNLSSLEIYDKVRALTFLGKPLPYTIVENQKIEFVWKGKNYPNKESENNNEEIKK